MRLYDEIMELEPNKNECSFLDCREMSAELAKIQEERSKAFQQLAMDARAGLDRKEINSRKAALNSVRVVDFGGAIDDLRSALRARK
jgi:hypothetical protein